MAFSFSVGPWWFYLLSGVLLFEKSWLLTSVLIAILTATKFYLAFQIGTFFYWPVAISTAQIGWAENFKHDYEQKVQSNPNWQQDTVKIKPAGGSHLSITLIPT